MSPTSLDSLQPGVELSVMPLVGQLLDELHKEVTLVTKLALEDFKILEGLIAQDDVDLEVVDQDTELLDAEQNLPDELTDLGLFPSKHGQVEDLVEE